MEARARRVIVIYIKVYYHQGQFYDTYPANGDLDPSLSEYESLGNVLVLQSGDDLIADKFRFKGGVSTFNVKGTSYAIKTVIKV